MSATNLHSNLSTLAGQNGDTHNTDFVRPLHEVERLYIETVIKLSDGNIPKAAQSLEISPSTLYRKIARWHNAQNY